MNKPLSLSDRQLLQVRTTAALLPVHARDSFMRSIAGRLADIATPNDDDVYARHLDARLFVRQHTTKQQSQEEQSMRHKHFDAAFDENGRCH
jgi:hypothetical protein